VPERDLDHPAPKKSRRRRSTAPRRRSRADSRGCDVVAVIQCATRFVNRSLTTKQEDTMSVLRKLNGMEAAVIGGALLMTLAPLVPYALLG